MWNVNDILINVAAFMLSEIFISRASSVKRESILSVTFIKDASALLEDDYDHSHATRADSYRARLDAYNALRVGPNDITDGENSIGS